MGKNEHRSDSGRGNLKVAGRTAAIAMAALLMLSCGAGTAKADDEVRRAGDMQGGSYYETKIYGTVESLPKDVVGVWKVNGREIVVSQDTWIKEKHGRADAGAYVKVKGIVTGKTFYAHEVEVKRSKGGGR